MDAAAGRIGARSVLLKPVNLDLAGAALLAVTAGWFLLPAASGRVEPWPALGLLAAVAGAGLMARAIGRWVSPLLPSALVMAAAAAALPQLGDSSGPLGYANANGLYFVLATIAALTVWLGRPHRLVGAGALAAAVVFALATLISDSLAATILLVGVGAVAVAVKWNKQRVAAVVCGTAVGASLATTAVLGFTYSDGNNAVSSALTERRIALWHDALEIAGSHPLTGAGWHSFQALSPTALGDPDARWAHNEFLQVGAEMGWFGLTLVGLLFVWAFTRLTIQPVSAQAALAAAALAAVGVHASIDYVLHFAAVPLAAAVLAGAALAQPTRTESQ